MARDHTTQAPATAAGTQLLIGLGWARMGFEQVRREPTRWLPMSTWYLVPAVVLGQIPFAGPLLVVLLSPLLWASALLALAEPSKADPGTPKERWMTQPLHELGRAFSDAAHVYPLVLLAIVTLGLLVTVFIVEHVFGIGSLSALRNASTVSVIPSISILAGLIVAGLLHVALFMALFYAVHRVLFAKRDPLNAMEDSFGACWRHGWAIAGLALAYLVPYVAVVTAFSLSRAFGYFLLLTIGLVALPAFVIASYRSYGEVFPAKTPG